MKLRKRLSLFALGIMLCGFANELGTIQTAASSVEDTVDKAEEKTEPEIESKTLVELFHSIKPRASLSYHATGSIIYWDYGHKGLLRRNNYKLAQKVQQITGYSYVNGFNKYYASGFSDWVSIKQKTPAVTIEIGRTRCPLGISSFPQIWKENKLLFGAVAKLY